MIHLHQETIIFVNNGLTKCREILLTLGSLLDKVGLGLIGDFQEAQQHLLLSSQHNSMSPILCTGAICMNTSKNAVPLYNESIKITLSLLAMIAHSAVQLSTLT